MEKNGIQLQDSCQIRHQNNACKSLKTHNDLQRKETGLRMRTKYS